MLAIIFERAIETVFIFSGKIKNPCNVKVLTFRAVIELLKDKFLTFYDLQHRKKIEQSGYIFLSYLFLSPFYLSCIIKLIGNKSIAYNLYCQ